MFRVILPILTHLLQLMKQRIINSSIVLSKYLITSQKIQGMLFELVKGDISSNLGASLAHALLFDLRAMGLLIPNIDIKNIYMDKCKIEQRLK